MKRITDNSYVPKNGNYVVNDVDQFSANQKLGIHEDLESDMNLEFAELVNALRGDGIIVQNSQGTRRYTSNSRSRLLFGYDDDKKDWYFTYRSSGSSKFYLKDRNIKWYVAEDTKRFKPFPVFRLDYLVFKPVRDIQSGCKDISDIAVFTLEDISKGDDEFKNGWIGTIYQQDGPRWFFYQRQNVVLRVSTMALITKMMQFLEDGDVYLSEKGLERRMKE